MGDMIIVVPEALKPLGNAFVSLLQAVKETRDRSRGGARLPYERVEETFEEHVGGIERAAHQTTLEALDIDVPRIMIRGKVYARTLRCPTTYYTGAGPVEVPRTLYRELGARNPKTVDPLALRIGTVADNWLPATAKGMAFFVQASPSREAHLLAQQAGRYPYCRASFDRVFHAVGEIYKEEHLDVEEDLIQEYQVPEEAAAVSAALDRVSVPMEEPRENCEPNSHSRRLKGKTRKRCIARNFRMAYCGTVTLHNGKSEALHTIRYGCMPLGDAHGMVERMASDIRAFLGTRDDLKVAILSDGAEEMWNLLEAHIRKETIGKKVERVLDFYHVIEKLSPAFDAIYGESKPFMLVHWKLQLAREPGTAESLLELLRSQEARSARWSEEEAQAVHEARTYFENHHEKMEYPKARRKGLPIGSGNVEATCKTLVGVRMKRAGSRWKHSTGGHLIQLRALALSDRWNPAVERALSTRRTSIQAAA